MEEATQHGYVSADAIASAYAAIGDTTRALDMLERAANEHSFTLIFLGEFLWFESLHGNPRYRKIVERVGVVGPKQRSH